MQHRDFVLLLEVVEAHQLALDECYSIAYEHKNADWVLWLYKMFGGSRQLYTELSCFRSEHSNIGEDVLNSKYGLQMYIEHEKSFEEKIRFTGEDLHIYHNIIFKVAKFVNLDVLLDIIPYLDADLCCFVAEKSTNYGLDLIPIFSKMSIRLRMRAMEHLGINNLLPTYVVEHFLANVQPLPWFSSMMGLNDQIRKYRYLLSLASSKVPSVDTPTFDVYLPLYRFPS